MESIAIMPTSAPSLGSFQHLLHVKLSSSNYILWKNQFEPILNYTDLHSVIDKSSPVPEKIIIRKEGQPTMNPVYLSWWRKDQLLWSWIISSLIEEVLPYTIGLTSSLEIWETLRETFGAPTQSRLLQLQMQLFNLRKGDQGVLTYLRQVQLIVDELAATRTILERGTINVAIFNNIGNEFSEVVAALSAREDSSSFATISSTLINHEIRMGQIAAMNLSTTSAQYTAYKGGNKHRQQSRGGQTSGGRNSAVGAGTSIGKSQKSGYCRDPCPICESSEHGPYKCLFKAQAAATISQHRNLTSSNAIVAPPPALPSAYIAQATNLYSGGSSAPLVGSSDWVVDSGATHHFTPHLSNFTHVDQQFAKGLVRLGDGSRQPIQHFGSGSGHSPNSTPRFT